MNKETDDNNDAMVYCKKRRLKKEKVIKL